MSLSKQQMQSQKQASFFLDPWFIPFLYIFGRIIFYLGMVSNGLFGFGDVQRYYEVAALNGYPFFNYWIEYPPLFPFICTLIYRLAGGQPIIFEAAIYFLLTLAGAASLYIFINLEILLFPQASQQARTWVYLSFLLVLSYTWWYFEMIPVCFLLLAIWYILQNKTWKSGWIIGLGILTKWFPGLLLPAVWRLKPRKTAIRITFLSLGMTLFIYLVLWTLSPVMTQASLVSQPMRNSWQTVWAWIDQNNIAGAIANPPDLTNPNYLIDNRAGNSPVIPPFLRLVVFGSIGLFFWVKCNRDDPQSLLGLIGITWAVFLLWSSGWSPQWILYLIPLILLTFPFQQAFFWNLVLIILSFLEWPTLIGHKFFIFMGPIALVRSLVFIILIVYWYRSILSQPSERHEPAALQNVVE